MTHTLEFQSLPSSLSGFLKAITSGGNGLASGETIPRIHASCLAVVADPVALRKYRSLCNFRDDGFLPASYPHVLAAPLHLQVLTHKAFPFKLLGAVHVRNAVTQHRSIRSGEALDVAVTVEGHRDVDAGVEFDLVTRITDTMGDVPWESTSTNLIRGKSAGGSKKKGGWTPPDWSAYELVESWTTPEDIGRRYGLIAGDVNPIHMHALAAKPFGFPRAIAHGMFSYARCVSRIAPPNVAAMTLTVSFKRPVLLPSKVELLMREDDAGRAYLLTNPERDTVYLEGRVDRVAASPASQSPMARSAAPASATKRPSSKASTGNSAAATKTTKKPAAAGKAARKATSKAATKKKPAAKKSAAKKSAAKKTAARKSASTRARTDKTTS